MGDAAMKQPRFEVYPSKDGYRWRLIAANGRILADSGETYTRERDAHRAVEVVTAAASKIETHRIVARIKGGLTAGPRA